MSVQSFMYVFLHETGLLCWQLLRISPCSSKTTLGSLHLTSSGKFSDGMQQVISKGFEGMSRLGV